VPGVPVAAGVPVPESAAVPVAAGVPVLDAPATAVPAGAVGVLRPRDAGSGVDVGASARVPPEPSPLTRPMMSSRPPSRTAAMTMPTMKLWSRIIRALLAGKALTGA
jgi:hypothetical protein